jgi:hypothetical protein
MTSDVCVWTVLHLVALITVLEVLMGVGEYPLWLLGCLCGISRPCPLYEVLAAAKNWNRRNENLKGAQRELEQFLSHMA